MGSSQFKNQVEIANRSGVKGDRREELQRGKRTDCLLSLFISTLSPWQPTSTTGGGQWIRGDKGFFAVHLLPPSQTDGRTDSFIPVWPPPPRVAVTFWLALVVSIDAFRGPRNTRPLTDIGNPPTDPFDDS